MRQIVLDTETTGLAPSHGHRLIEVAAVELVDRRITGREFSVLLNPEREVDDVAAKVHGKTWADLKEHGPFAHSVDEFLAFVSGAEWIIHNASFDLRFLDHEMRLAGRAPVHAIHPVHTGVVDTMTLARSMGHGRTTLDGLCDRYGVPRTDRDVHGALIDARLLAAVYCRMTATQLTLDVPSMQPALTMVPVGDRPALAVIQPTAEEMALHTAYIAEMEAVFGKCVWRPRLAA